jgi:hypothetical protein
MPEVVCNRTHAFSRICQLRICGTATKFSDDDLSITKYLVRFVRMQKKSKNSRDTGLFPSEAEIAKRLNQNFSRWPAKAIILERHGFPRIDPLMGGRYWPAVEAYWHRRYGLSRLDVHQPDGKENFDAL